MNLQPPGLQIQFFTNLYISTFCLSEKLKIQLFDSYKTVTQAEMTVTAKDKMLVNVDVPVKNKS